MGIVTGVSAYVGYAATILLDHGSDVAEGRTTATLTVLIISLWTVLVLARPLTGWKLMLVAGLAVAVAVIVAVPAYSCSRSPLYVWRSPRSSPLPGRCSLS